MNPANALTLSRVVLTGFFMAAVFSPGLGSKVLALGFFVVAILTDYWDGTLARRLECRTVLGEFLDPLADKILVFGAFISFVEMDILPAWMVVVLLAREISVTGLRIIGLSRGVSLPAVRAGKHKTFLQFVTVLGVLVFLVLSETPLWREGWTETAIEAIHFLMFFVVGITLTSGMVYAVRHWGLITGQGNRTEEAGP